MSDGLGQGDYKKEKEEREKKSRWRQGSSRADRFPQAKMKDVKANDSEANDTEAGFSITSIKCYERLPSTVLEVLSFNCLLLLFYFLA